MPESCETTEALRARFQAHVSTDTGLGPWGTCHVWTGSATKEGYGRFRIGNKIHRAHRVALYLWTGVWPTAPCVMHSCDFPPCVNGEHLEEGTKARNNGDMKARGRARGGGPPGERNGAAKLTESQVIAIRADTRPQVEVGLEYGVHQTTISAIKRGKKWAHV